MLDSSGRARTAPRTNLPLQLTNFIGRERESQEILRLLSSERLLTLTGPPGCGKTRLALETGRTLLGQFPDGVWMVDLSQISDPTAVALLILESLELVVLGDTSIEKVVVDYLRHQKLLLIIDNCEHMVEEAARLCLAILSACPRVQVLATSQLALGIPGEQEWLVPSLSMPEENDQALTLEELHQFGAVRLFEERARAALHSFTQTTANASLVIKICRRLDGIPLAIELAAARVKLFTLQEIERQLDNRFELFAAPRRMVASRHQTLQAAIDWSFHLLSMEEQILLYRLAVFTGSFSLEAAAEVCGYEPLNPSAVAALLMDLVDRSLVSVRRREEEYTRYYLLESIRLYGLAQISEEEHARLKDRHLGYYARIAALLDQQPSDFVPGEQIGQLEADWPNISAAAGWVLAAQDRARLYTGLRMTVDFFNFLRQRDHFLEPATWLEAMLPLANTEDTPDWLAVRAKAFQVLGQLEVLQYCSSAQNVCEQYETSRELWKKLGSSGKIGYAHATYWASYNNSDLQKALDYAQECREIFQAEEDWYGIAWSHYLESDLAQRMNNFSSAEKILRELHEELLRNENYVVFLGFASLDLTYVLQHTGQYEEAMYYAAQTNDIFQRIGSQRLIILGLMVTNGTEIAFGKIQQAEESIEHVNAIIERTNLEFFRNHLNYHRAEIFLLKHEYDKAAVCFHRCSRGYLELNLLDTFYAACIGLAASVAEKDPTRAARLYGFARKITGNDEKQMSHENTHAIFVERMKFARHLLGDAAFDRAVAEGAGWSLDEAIPPEELPVMSPAPPPAISPRKFEKAHFSGLTKREREIAAHIAHGLQNAAIAEELVISERTVTTHVTNILSRLGFSSRTQIAAWASEKGLAEA